MQNQQRRKDRGKEEQNGARLHFLLAINDKMHAYSAVCYIIT